MDTGNTISILNGLIETCRDGQQGFQEAAQYLTRKDLKQLFAETSAERARFVGELQSEVRGLGGDPGNSGTVAGALRRVWLDIKGTFTGMSDAAILDACARGEESALEDYRHALAAELPSSIRSIVARHYETVKGTLDMLRSQHQQAARA